MNVLWNILGLPLSFVYAVFRHLKVASPYVVGGLFSGHPVSGAAMSRFLGWLFLALVILVVVFFILKYILEDALSWPIAREEIKPILGSVFGRLAAVLAIYAGLAVVLYGFSSLSSMIVKDTSIPHRYTVPGNKLVN